MAINIKNERGVLAIERLAEHYGLSYAGAIDAAARDILARPALDVAQTAAAEAERIAAEYRAHQVGELSPESLYAEDGLYR